MCFNTLIGGIQQKKIRNDKNVTTNMENVFTYIA